MNNDDISNLKNFSVIYNLKIRDKLTEDIKFVSTSFSNELKIKDSLLKNVIPYDRYELYEEFKQVLIEHMKEIRNQDCSKVFYEGLQMGMEFQKYIDSKNN